MLSLEVALAWAVSAKNSLETHLGFSPNQLVFGRNPNYPACLRDKPPALEPPSGSDLVRTHLNAMHSARQAFIQNESSEKLRRALLHQVRPSGEKFCPGDVVLYRRNQDDKWRGPGTVIGQENKQILVNMAACTTGVTQTLSCVTRVNRRNPQAEVESQ